MENQDIKLFNQFKKAAENQAPKEFSGMESVWGAIETKLDNQVLKTQNKAWKKWAVAASVMLVGSIAYQILKSEETTIEKTKQPTIQNEIVKTNPIVSDSVETHATASAPTPKNSKIIEKREEVLKRELSNEKEGSYIITETTVDVKKVESLEEIKGIPSVNDDSYKYYLRENTSNVATSSTSNGYVKEGDKYVTILADSNSESKAKKQNPLVVKDGELVKDYDENDPDVELIIELSNPLYIINGVRYSESELFGDYPTSPYYPLKKQKITSCTVIKPEDAVKAYGAEGANGVVIIATKDGKPRGK